MWLLVGHDMAVHHHIVDIVTEIEKLATIALWIATSSLSHSRILLLFVDDTACTNLCSIESLMLFNSMTRIFVPGPTQLVGWGAALIKR
jgi:hypothetical protein